MYYKYIKSVFEGLKDNTAHHYNIKINHPTKNDKRSFNLNHKQFETLEKLLSVGALYSVEVLQYWQVNDGCYYQCAIVYDGLKPVYSTGVLWGGSDSAWTEKVKDYLVTVNPSLSEAYSAWDLFYFHNRSTAKTKREFKSFCETPVENLNK